MFTVEGIFAVKMIDPTAMSRFTALREAAGKIDRLVPLMDAALSVEEAPPAAGMPTATVSVSIPSGHTLTKGPTVALGMLSNHADLLHSYCGEEGCICMEYVLNLVWTEGAPS